jgi:hypothetical protein
MYSFITDVVKPIELELGTIFVKKVSRLGENIRRHPSSVTVKSVGRE